MATSRAESWWIDSATAPERHPDPPSGALPTHAAAVVIGAGLSGLGAALRLVERGVVDVIVLEQRGISGGATGHNGGHLKAGGSADQLELEEWVVGTTAALAQKWGIECDIRFPGSVTVARSEDDAQRLRDQHAASDPRQRAALWTAEQCEVYTGSSEFVLGLHHPTSGQIWPAKLAVGLAQAATAAGVQLFPDVTVSGLETAASGAVNVLLADGSSLLAETVIVATNGWASELLPELRTAIRPVTNQALVTAPAPRLWTKIGAVSTMPPPDDSAEYGYCLQREDGRVVLGMSRGEAWQW